MLASIAKKDRGRQLRRPHSAKLLAPQAPIGLWDDRFCDSGTGVDYEETPPARHAIQHLFSESRLHFEFRVHCSPLHLIGARDHSRQSVIAGVRGEQIGHCAAHHRAPVSNQATAMLEALEDYVKRQKERLERGTKEAAN
jgi:hypothetical protein